MSASDHAYRYVRDRDGRLRLQYAWVRPELRLRPGVKRARRPADYVLRLLPDLPEAYPGEW